MKIIFPAKATGPVLVAPAFEAPTQRGVAEDPAAPMAPGFRGGRGGRSEGGDIPPIPLFEPLAADLDKAESDYIPLHHFLV